MPETEKIVHKISFRYALFEGRSNLTLLPFILDIVFRILRQ